MQLLKWSKTWQLTFIGKRCIEKTHKLKSQIRTLWSKETLIILVESTWMQFTLSLWPFKVWMQEALEIKTTDILSVHQWFPHRIRKMFPVTYSSTYPFTHPSTVKPVNQWQNVSSVDTSPRWRVFSTDCISFFFLVRCTINLYTFLRQTNKFQYHALFYNCKFSKSLRKWIPTAVDLKE